MPHLQKDEAWCVIQLSTSGTELRITSGVEDTPGKTDVQTFQNPLRARWEHDLALRKKIEEGFTLVVEDGPPPVAAEDFEALLSAEDPSDEAFLIYGDWLEASGDPRGELIAVQSRLAQRPLPQAERDQLERAELVLTYQHRERLLGALGTTIVHEGAQRYATDLLHLSWHLGFVKEARTRSQYTLGGELESDLDVDALLGMLCASPSLRFLRSLSFGPFEDQRLETAIEALQGAQLPATLDHLEFLGCDDGAGRLLPHPPQPLTREAVFFARHARLSSLILRDVCFEEPVNLSRLSKLELSGAIVRQRTVDAMGQSKLPNLRQLTLRGEWLDPAAVLDSLMPVLELRVAPKLEVLQLDGASNADQFAEQLARSPLSKRLRDLELLQSDLSDRGAQFLGGALEALQSVHLQSHLLTPAARRALKTAATRIIIDNGAADWEPV